MGIRSIRSTTMIPMAVPMILSEATDEERARWLRLIVLIGLAGVIIIFSRDIIQFMSGITIPVPPPSTAACPSGGTHAATGLPCDTVRVLSQFFVLARYLGVAIVAAGGIFGVVKL